MNYALKCCGFILFHFREREKCKPIGFWTQTDVMLAKKTKNNSGRKFMKKKNEIFYSVVNSVESEKMPSVLGVLLANNSNQGHKEGVSNLPCVYEA